MFLFVFRFLSLFFFFFFLLESGPPEVWSSRVRPGFAETLLAGSLGLCLTMHN